MMLKLGMLRLGGPIVKSSKEILSKDDSGERLSILSYLDEM